MTSLVPASQAMTRLIVNLGTRVAAHSLNEIEALLPVGDYLRGKTSLVNSAALRPDERRPFQGRTVYSYAFAACS
jgi:hypothetical protein